MVDYKLTITCQEGNGNQNSGGPWVWSFIYSKFFLVCFSPMVLQTVLWLGRVTQIVIAPRAVAHFSGFPSVFLSVSMRSADISALRKRRVFKFVLHLDFPYFVLIFGIKAGEKPAEKKIQQSQKRKQSVFSFNFLCRVRKWRVLSPSGQTGRYKM